MSFERLIYVPLAWALINWLVGVGLQLYGFHGLARVDPDLYEKLGRPGLVYFRTRTELPIAYSYLHHDPMGTLTPKVRGCLRLGFFMLQTSLFWVVAAILAIPVLGKVFP